MGGYQNAVFYRDGSSSTVYKARGPDSNEEDSSPVFALKLTTPSRMAAPHDSEREARTLARLKNISIIPLVETFMQAGGHLVLVFPFMPYDLAQLTQERSLSPSQSKSHLRSLFSALAYLHNMGFIHRDVKPSNILLRSPLGPAYLADFGIVWVPDDPASEPKEEKTTDVGTTSYRPPELLFGDRSYGCSLDLWAAGCVVAEVAGQLERALFDSGEFGSELALIRSIFESLGTPTLECWPVSVLSEGLGEAY